MRAPLACVSIALFAAACGPNSRDFTKEHRPHADKIREQIGRLAAEADARPVKPNETCKPPRPLKYDPEGAGHNTDYITLEAAKKGVTYKPGETENSKLRIQGPLQLYLVWMHPDHDWATRNEAVNDRAVEIVKRAQKVEFVVLTKETLNSDKGELVIDWYLADLTSSQIVCAKSFSTRKGITPGATYLDSSELWKELNEKFADQMALNLAIKVK